MQEIQPGEMAEWDKLTRCERQCMGPLEVMALIVPDHPFLLHIQHCRAMFLMKDDEDVFLVLNPSDWEDARKSPCEMVVKTFHPLNLPKRGNQSLSPIYSMKEQKKTLRKLDAVRARQRRAEKVVTLAVTEDEDAHQVPLVRDPPRFFGRVPPSSAAQ